ncbi:hypothetical protein PYW07_009977 [Mythimna separata]|uniref:Uncharacterized protein n=1 Tax=Mythimna separata TaxID=271217 RepID=A0AAD7YGM9_MYTSE|nr:hypothetical protein PYW07_009977 [Mythimna separata]
MDVVAFQPPANVTTGPALLNQYTPPMHNSALSIGGLVKMPQRRSRNEEGGEENVPQNLSFPAMASGDSCTIYQQEEILTKNKNKVPRSMRYELEDALVGLCDAWFDEIKPHLLRNNIKLHIGGSSSGGPRHCVPASPSDPTADPGKPSPADDCTHLDPASSPDCKLCQLLVTAASCIERASMQAAGTTPPSPFAVDFGASDNSRCSSDSDPQL